MLNGSLSRKTWLARLALGVWLLATVFASLQVKKDIEQEAVRQFAFTCDQVILKIHERLGAYALILRGGGAIFAMSVQPIFLQLVAQRVSFTTVFRASRGLRFQWYENVR